MSDPQARTRTPEFTTEVTVHVDGTKHAVRVDNRVTVLDLLRDHLGVTAPKKGCDHGQCGACTVLLDGRRATTCLALAVSHDGAQAGGGDDVGTVDALHPVAQAFVDHDGFQCGYCTPGHICSAVGMLDELESGAPSHVSADLDQTAELTAAEIRERMSGNLCRCAAYPNIVAAIASVAGRSDPRKVTP